MAFEGMCRWLKTYFIFTGKYLQVKSRCSCSGNLSSKRSFCNFLSVVWLSRRRSAVVTHKRSICCFPSIRWLSCSGLSTLSCIRSTRTASRSVYDSGCFYSINLLFNTVIQFSTTYCFSIESHNWYTRYDLSSIKFHEKSNCERFSSPDFVLSVLD